MPKPWLAIVWFAAWGLFQAYVLARMFRGTWKRPPAFPEEAYCALVYPDLAFIPLYAAASVLLATGHPMGRVVGLVAGGGVLYVMIYLIALSRLKGVANLVSDGLFLVLNLAAMGQILDL